MASNVPNPSVAQRAQNTWWTAPIGVGTVNPSLVYLADLPTADPHSVGALYLLAGVLTVSAG